MSQIDLQKLITDKKISLDRVSRYTGIPIKKLRANLENKYIFTALEQISIYETYIML